MATALAPSENDIYLALLAGRAVTGLAKLASGTEVWDDKIDGYIRDGLQYCRELETVTEPGTGPVVAEFDSVVKRLTAQPVPIQPLVNREEIAGVTNLLNILLETRQAEKEDLSMAIGFFVKASSGHRIQMPGENSLF